MYEYIAGSVVELAPTYAVLDAGGVGYYLQISLQTYSEIDLSGMDSLTAEDMIAAEKHLMRTGVFSPLPEMTVEYVQFIAARASGQPVEFFKGLPPKDAIKVKNRVTSFFYGED